MIKTIRVTLGVIVLAGTTIGVIHFSNYLFTKEVIAIQETITEQREKANPVELTAITDTIVEYNKTINKLKPFSKIRVLDWFFCDEFDEIDNIE